MAPRLVKFLLFGVFITLILGASATYYATEHILPYSAIRPHRVTKAEIAQIIPAAASFSPAEKFSLTVSDSIELQGIILRAREQARGVVLILHGIGNCKEGMLSSAEFFLQSGFDCVIFDQRAHGESGGEYCTFGYYEKHDAARVIDLIEVKLPGRKIFLYGNSLGAGIGLQAMSIDKRISAGIIESPFSDLRSVAYDYFVRIAGIPFRFISDAALDNSERIANFSADSASPMLHAGSISQPVLLIHGREDAHIYVEHSLRIFPHIASSERELYIVDGAHHYNMADVGGQEYRRRILSFLEKNTR